MLQNWPPVIQFCMLVQLRLAGSPSHCCLHSLRCAQIDVISPLTALFITVRAMHASADQTLLFGLRLFLSAPPLTLVLITIDANIKRRKKSNTRISEICCELRAISSLYNQTRIEGGRLSNVFDATKSLNCLLAYLILTTESTD